MTPSDTPGTPPAPGPAGEPEGGLSGLTQPAHADARGGARLWAAAVTAGIVAGVIAWLGGEAVYQLVPSPRPTGAFGSYTPAEVQQAMRADLINTVLVFGLLGAILGLSLGLAGGLVRRSARAMGVASVVGLVVGGLVAVAVTVGGMMAYRRLLQVTEEDNLLLALGTHTAIWMIIGAAGGLAWSLGLGLSGRGQMARVVLGGLLGAAAGTIVYELVGGLAFPLAGTHRLLAMTGLTRLLARLLVTTLTAIGVVWVVRPAGRPSVAGGS